jgi:hypothetical protein
LKLITDGIDAEFVHDGRPVVQDIGDAAADIGRRHRRTVAHGGALVGRLGLGRLDLRPLFAALGEGFRCRHALGHRRGKRRDRLVDAAGKRDVDRKTADRYAAMLRVRADGDDLGAFGYVRMV